MLRNQVADKLNAAKANLEGVRKQMATAGDFTNLTTVGSLISQLQQIAGEVRHAEQGYSGWVASVTIDQNRLNKLYDYDYDFVELRVRPRGGDLAPPTSSYDPASAASIMAPLSRGQRSDLGLQAEVGRADGSGKGYIGEAAAMSHEETV